MAKVVARIVLTGGPCGGKTILEIELTNKKIIFPPYISIIREITNDSDYDNYNIVKEKVLGR